MLPCLLWYGYDVDEAMKSSAPAKAGRKLGVFPSRARVLERLFAWPTLKVVLWYEGAVLDSTLSHLYGRPCCEE